MAMQRAFYSAKVFSLSNITELLLAINQHSLWPRSILSIDGEFRPCYASGWSRDELMKDDISGMIAAAY
jgi:hypothetical protein